MGRSLVLLLIALASLVRAAGAAGAADTAADRALNEDDLRGLAWRSIGPANMNGRIAAIAVAPGNSRTFFVGYATGGVWKTTNNGTTFTPVFDEHETASIGALAVCDAPPDWAGWDDEEPDPGAEDVDEDAAEDADRGRAKIVWVGTGEGNGRNSSSWGHGVYRSTDGGGAFEPVGLADTHDIPALAVDPHDPDVCFIAALGHLWGSNAQRGVYRTTDGGRTWKAVLQVDEETGACDVIIDPDDPDVIFAALYARRRTPHGFRAGGGAGGIYRSLDGGDRWQKLSEGLPEHTGRIGIDICRSDPSIVCAVVESADGGWVGGPFSNRMRGGGVFRSSDGGDTWTRMTDFNPRAFYFSRIRIDPVNSDRVYLLGWGLYVSDDGGRTFRAGAAKAPHVDYHAMVIDPDDTDHLLIGTDGGLYASWDRGKTWDFHDHVAAGQFYNVAVDDSDPYRVGGGLQDNGTWVGPSETIIEATGGGWGRKGAITNRDWRFIWGGDGFHLAFDPENPNILYAESQGGNLHRIHRDTGVHRTLRPSPREGQPRFRFNWNAPFFISPHDPTTLYFGGNHVFRLTERGDRWERISEDLTAQRPEEIVAVGSDAETHGTIVSLAESPLVEGRLWAGTDDGLVHVTDDGGESWTDVTPDAVDGLYVSKIEPSRHDADTAYVAVDGHRSDVFTPILLRTDDAGVTWKSIAGDLPDGAPPKVVREDPRNGDVLYVGTERAAYVTIDGGTHWIRLNHEQLPTVAVDDLAIQVREMDLVAGTHGRSIWILDDISPLSQLTSEVLASPLHVFSPQPGRPRHYLRYGGLWSDRMFVAPNPPRGAAISYWISAYAPDDVKISIADASGHVVRTLTGSNRPGINRVHWDLQPAEDQRLGNDDGLTQYVAAGAYTVKATLGDHAGQTTLEVGNSVN
ncbi:MAG: glycosyl hydrolase [Planctomycetes bacterium]|nr:glycosyl hydrolase [Planctomycetota bacterium]